MKINFNSIFFMTIQAEKYYRDGSKNIRYPGRDYRQEAKTFPKNIGGRNLFLEKNRGRRVGLNMKKVSKAIAGF